ncbi:MAG TPA: DNA polymerase III subunit delta [Xanthomonadaceae bacterium]|nr:DNA polymerase III subunit delta [Xanthomonadaceae bacterium]
MELTPERLVAQLDNETLRPVYLIAGAEPLRVLEAADAVRLRARAQGIGEREIFDVDARFNWSLLEASLHAPSLFSAQRLLEVRLPSGKPGTDGAKLLGGFCADPPPDVVLLVTCDEWSRQHGGKWSEAIARVGHVVVAWPVKAHELPEWIERRMRARGLRANRDAVQVLAERVEGNLLAAAQEIDKLALLDEGATIDAARMESLVADAARFDVFRLLDAAMNGQGAHAARMLAGLRAEGIAVPALLGMVAMELQRAAALAQVQARGGNLAAEFKAQRIWDSKQAAYKRALTRHDAARWDEFVARIGRVDRAAKGRGDGDPWQQLERVLLAVADAKAARLVAG